MRLGRFVGILIVAMIAAGGVVAQPRPAVPTEPETIALWPNGAPEALGAEDRDKPTLTFYPARQANGTAILVAPGGGYSNLAPSGSGCKARRLCSS